MRGWVKTLVVLFVVGVLVLAGLYAYHRWQGRSAPIDMDGPTGPDGTNVRVNESAVSVYIGKMDSQTSLTGLGVRLYGPGIGHGDWNLSTSTPSAGNWTKTDILPEVSLSYRDLNGDGMASNGEYFTVQSQHGPLATGIWHLELRSSGITGRSVTFHIHVFPENVTSYPQNLEVDFIDVGQGDAELITTSDGRHVLIDTGTPLSENALVSYLHNRSITVLDALILTHPDADHIGGADEVIGAFEVRSIYHPGLVKDTATFRSFIAAAAAEGCPVLTSSDVHAGDYLDLSMTEELRVLSINASSEANDASIVLRLTSENASVLFTGDIGTSVESALVSTYPSDLDVDVLKVGHHGSRYSSCDLFLDAVSPEEAVIEVGQNTYGHPSEETLARLADHGSEIIRTDSYGTYAYIVTGDTIL